MAKKSDTTFELKGFDELFRKLANLDKKVATKALRVGITNGAKIVQNRAKQFVPVDKGISKKAIKVRSGKRKKGRVSKIIGLHQDAFRAAFVETGTKDIPAQPFLRPAIRISASDIKRELIEEINRVINEESEKR